MRVITAGTAQPWRYLWHSGNLTPGTQGNASMGTAYISSGGSWFGQVGSNTATPQGMVCFNSGLTSLYSRYEIDIRIGATTVASFATSGIQLYAPVNGWTWLSPALHSAGGQMPTMGVRQAIMLIEDEHPNASVYWTTPTGQSTIHMAGGSRVITAANSQVAQAANFATWILMGPSYAGGTVCSLLVC
jgi:hypothetical protein